MLKVTVAEVQRDVIKQLGVDLTGSLGTGTSVVNFNNTNPFPLYGQPLVHSTDDRLANSSRSRRRCAPWNAPASSARWPSRTLTAISGESANFLAGGEFPIVSRYTSGAAGRSHRHGRVQEIRREPELHAGGALAKAASASR